MVFEHHKARHQNCGLQEGGQTKADDLFDPLDKAICVASWDAEHVQTSHGDLDEQDPAPLEIGEEHLDHRIGHEDDAEDDHNGTGDDTQAKAARGARHLCDTLHSIEVLNDLLAHRSNTGPKAGEPGGKGPLQGHRQGVEPHGDGGKQAYRQEPFQNVQGGVLDIGPAGGIVDPTFKNTNHQTHAEQRPAQLGKKQDDSLHPVQVKQLHSHVAHLGEKIPQKPYHLTIEPVDEVVHNSGRHKIKNKDSASPHFHTVLLWGRIRQT